MHHPDPPYAARLAAYGTTATRLSLLSDRRLGDIVASASPAGAGIGGRSAELDIDGTRVFVKRVPLTDVETRPENVRSTANLFGLPTFYQYGVGSAGFGAWRELAVHTMTTNWVLTGEYEGFPLMYHWRVLPDSPPDGFVDEFGGIDGAVAHWDGSRAVRGRLEAIGRSSHSLVLFLEHVPQTLGVWLHERRASAVTGDGSPYVWAENALAQGAAFMGSRGLVHFDAHFRNVLTDGRLVYFADFGLALSAGFELSAAEERFHTDHLAYDRHYIAGHLLRHHLVDHLRGDTETDAFLQGWIAGRRPDGVLPEIAAIVERHARTAVVLDDFHRRLLTESKQTPYPAAELDRARGDLNALSAGPRGTRAGYSYVMTTSPPDSPADFASRLTAAEAWTDAAVGAHQEGAWVLTAEERRILEDVAAATNPLHGGRLPPFNDESLYVRLGRIRNWAGALRLAARAGGWELRPVTGTDPSSSGPPMGMADLLSGIYALAEQGERWQRLMLEVVAERNAAARSGTSQERPDLGEALDRRRPGFAKDLAAAEAFFTGPGSLEDLLLFFD